MGVDSTGYEILLILHILAVVIGFGGLFFQGVLLRRARRRTAGESLALVDAAQAMSYSWAVWFVLVVPLFGIGLVASSRGTWSFQQGWVGSGLLLWVIAAGILTGMLRPNQIRIQELLAGLPPGRALGARGAGGTSGPGEASGVGGAPRPGGAGGAGGGIGGAGARDGEALAELDQRLARAENLIGALDLILVIVVVLMVVKPGS